MPQSKTSPIATIPAGSLNPDEFQVLFELSTLRKQVVKDALFDHYVNGLGKSDSADRHGIDPATLARALRVSERTLSSALWLARLYNGRNDFPVANLGTTMYDAEEALTVINNLKASLPEKAVSPKAPSLFDSD